MGHRVKNLKHSLTSTSLYKCWKTRPFKEELLLWLLLTVAYLITPYWICNYPYSKAYPVNAMKYYSYPWNSTSQCCDLNRTHSIAFFFLYWYCSEVAVLFLWSSNTATIGNIGDPLIILFWCIVGRKRAQILDVFEHFSFPQCII